MRGARRDPPRLATRLLLVLLPEDARGRSIAGDLAEEWHARSAGVGRDLWYLRQCLGVGVRYALVRGRVPGASGAGLLEDLRLAIRGVRRAPSTALLTVLALAVGVAAPTIMFSLLVGVTRALPVPEPDELVHVGWRYTPYIVRGTPIWSLRPLLEERRPPELASLGAFQVGQHDVATDEGYPQRLRAAALTPGVLPTLGVEPALGRVFGPGDVAAAESRPTAIVSNDLWRASFGARTDALGRTLRVDGVPHTVVGVMPPGFAFPDGVDFWRPLDPADTVRYGFAEVVGRLAPGTRVDGLQDRVQALSDDFVAEGRWSAEARGALDATPWSERAIGRDMRGMLRSMLAVVSFVLVIACANVAHLLLARALAHRQSTAVRLALGAGRWRIVRQHLAESGVLAVLGGLLGLAVAGVGVRLLAGAMAPRLAWWMEIRLDPTVLLFATALVLGAALLTALLPALQSTRLAGGGALGSARGSTAGRGIARATAGLVVLEVALTCALLVVAGLLTRGALRNLTVQEGYETASVLVGTYVLDPGRHPGEEEVLAFHRTIVESLAERPEVAAVSLATHMPGIFTAMDEVEVEGVEGEPPRTHVTRIAPGYLDVLGVAPLRGRDLRWSDGRGEPVVALVNEPFVRRHMAGVDPLGARVRIAPEDDDPEAAGGGWVTVVGVVPSLGMNGGLDPDDTGIYLPLAAAPPRGAHVFVRTRADVAPATLVPSVRAALAELDRDVALAEPRSLLEAIRANRDMESLFAALFSFFGVSGLVLAGVGLYGLTAFAVRRRLPELGIRSALGAGPRALVWSAVRGGVLHVVLGLGVGLALALVVAPVFAWRFMGYEARDPVAYGAVVLVLLATGVAATLGPARRAAAADVSEVLRAE